MEHKNHYDVIVVGGGFAGCGAAIAAAEQGSSVLLVEASNALGGAANVNLVNPFMRYYCRDKETRAVLKVLSKGIFERIVGELEKMGGFMGKGTVYQSAIFNEEYLKLILNRMTTEAGVTLLYHAYLCDADTADGRITAIEVATKSGKLKFSADCFIDATGDADLAVLAGCPYRLGREEDGLCQPMTLCFRVGNVDIDCFLAEKESMQALYKQWQAEGKIKNIRENVLVFRNVAPGVLHFNSTRIVRRDPTDVFDVTQAELEAREQVFELFDFLRTNFEAFRQSELIATAVSIGVRESRMIDGLYVLTGEDLKNCTMFEDSIALGNYDIDIHNPAGSGTSHYYFEGTDHYSIPYRSLVPQKCDNLLVAGRCISVTHEAQASIRIMPIVCCLGEAAGVAASLAVKEKGKPAEVNTDKLRAILTASGAAV